MRLLQARRGCVLKQTTERIDSLSRAVSKVRGSAPIVVGPESVLLAETMQPAASLDLLCDPKCNGITITS